MSEMKLDAIESVFFKRQLESVDSKAYEKKYPEYKARRLIPTIGGVDPTSRSYVYRMFDTLGKSKWIANSGDDLPRAEAKGEEASQIIKQLGASFAYSIEDIQTAAKHGLDLDMMQAYAARRAVEEQIDSVLALGDSANGMSGLLTLASGTTSYTPSTKDASGDTEWGTLAAPLATGEEMAMDLIALAAAGVQATKGAFSRYKILLPIEQFNLANATRLGDGSDVTAVKFAQGNEFIESIEPWFRCDGAAGGGVDRMVAFAASEEVVGALVPKEFTIGEPQLVNLEYRRACTAKCGGVVARYPVAIVYGDAI